MNKSMTLVNTTVLPYLYTGGPGFSSNSTPETDTGVSTDQSVEENAGPGEAGSGWAGLVAGLTGGTLLVLAIAVVLYLCVVKRRKRQRKQTRVERKDNKKLNIENKIDVNCVDGAPNESLYYNVGFVPEQSTPPTVLYDYDYVRTFGSNPQISTGEKSREKAKPSLQPSYYENTCGTREQDDSGVDKAQYQNLCSRNSSHTDKQTDGKYTDKGRSGTDLKRSSSHHDYVAMNKRNEKGIYDHLEHGNRPDAVIKAQDACYSHIEPSAVNQDTAVSRYQSVNTYQNPPELSDAWM